jgi:hypothetical protein
MRSSLSSILQLNMENRVQVFDSKAVGHPHHQFMMTMLTALFATALCSSCPTRPLGIYTATQINVSADAKLFKIECCSFHSISSKTTNGGAIHITRSTSNPDLFINACRFIRCQAKCGGAIWFSGQSFNITDSIADRCIASDVGGFMFIENTDGCLTRMTTTSSILTSMGSVYLQSDVDHHLRDTNSSSNVGGASLRVHRHLALSISFSRFDSNYKCSCLSIDDNTNLDSIWCSVIANNTCDGPLVKVMSRCGIGFTMFVKNTFRELIEFAGVGSLVVSNCYFDNLSIVASLMMIISSPHLRPDVACSFHSLSPSPHNRLGRPYVEAVRLNAEGGKRTPSLTNTASPTPGPSATIAATGPSWCSPSRIFVPSQFGDKTATYGPSAPFRGRLTFTSSIKLCESNAFTSLSRLSRSLGFVPSGNLRESVQMTASGTFSPSLGTNATATFSPSDQLTASDDLHDSAVFDSFNGVVISDVFDESADGSASFDFGDSDCIALSPKLDGSSAQFIDGSSRVGSTTAFVCSADLISISAMQMTNVMLWNRPNVINSFVFVKSNSLRGSNVVEWTVRDGVRTKIQSDDASTVTGVESLMTIPSGFWVLVGLVCGVWVLLIATIVVCLVVKLRRGCVKKAPDSVPSEDSQTAVVELEAVVDCPASALHTFTGFGTDTGPGTVPGYTDYLTCFEQDHEEMLCSMTFPTGFIA